MPSSRRLLQLGVRASLFFGIFALMTGFGFAAIPKSATDMGPENEGKQITVTVWLKLHNKANLDAMVKGIYDKASPNYHHFLTMDQYKAQFAPTLREAATVSNFLASHNLKITSVDQNNHFVVAQGSVGDMKKAFNVQIHRVMMNGRAHRMNTSEAAVAGAAGALISTVQGLSDFQYKAHVRPARNLATGVPYAGASLSSAGPDGLFFSGRIACVHPRQLLSRRREAFPRPPIPATGMERTSPTLTLQTYRRAVTMRPKRSRRIDCPRSTRRAWMELGRPS